MADNPKPQKPKHPPKKPIQLAELIISIKTQIGNVMARTPRKVWVAGVGLLALLLTWWFAPSLRHIVEPRFAFVCLIALLLTWSYTSEFRSFVGPRFIWFVYGPLLALLATFICGSSWLLTSYPWDQPWLSTVVCTAYLGYVAILTLWLWEFDISKLTDDWSNAWPTVSMNSGTIGCLIAFWSWFAPGIFWGQMAPWNLKLDLERENVIEWKPDPNSAQKKIRDKAPVNQQQANLIDMHRQSAVYWIGFWALIPPMWFLLEYAFVIPTVRPPATALPAGHDLARLKELQALAAKMWLAWIVLLATWHGVPKMIWMK